MYKRDGIDKVLFAEIMNTLKVSNQSGKAIESSKAYHIGVFLMELSAAIKSPTKLSTVMKQFCVKLRWRKLLRKYPNHVVVKNVTESISDPSCYFSDKRFIVYTSVFGKYDSLQEPMFCPDNCDFWFIGDMELPANTKWKKYNLSKIEREIREFSNAEKNRYCKMFPHKLFPEYEVSIYIDGNIVPVSDMTEFINISRQNGLSMHAHKARNCVYQEAEACRIMKKVSKETIDGYVKYLRESGFPDHYGLAECNVIVRDHQNEIMRNIMEQWWEQFINHVRRDQLSLPYVLWKNHLSVETVTVLGNNVFLNPALRISAHK